MICPRSWISLIIMGQTMEFDMGFVRANNLTATAVERGLAVALLSDIKTGARLMRGAGVPFTVALRVLLYPGKRRTGDWARDWVLHK